MAVYGEISMKQAIAYINLVGCIGLLIFCLVALATEDIGDSAEAMFAFIAIVVTTVSGIYLFAVRRNKRLAELESIITQNAMLQLKLEQDKLKQQLAGRE